MGSGASELSADERKPLLAGLQARAESDPSLTEFSSMDLTEHRGMTLAQFRDLEKDLKRRADKDGWLHGWVDRDCNTCHVDSVNLYDVVKYLVKPKTKKKNCSYVELVARAGTRAQTPKWFVSHWWGGPVLDFIACLELHAKVRVLSPDEAVYWVCAYSSNLHELGSDIMADPREPAFLTALQMCEGVVVVLDPAAIVFLRIWCIFEQLMAAQSKKLLLDFATVHSGTAQLLTDGFAYKEERKDVKAARERGFPLELIEKGYALDITKAEATREEDKRYILKSISGVDPPRGAHTRLCRLIYHEK